MNHSQDKRNPGKRGGRGGMVMYSTRLAGALMMTSCTLWPCFTPQRATSPLELELSTHTLERLESLCLLSCFSITSSHSSSSHHLLLPSQPHLSLSHPCHGGRVTVVSDLAEMGPVQLTSRSPQALRLVFEMRLHCRDRSNKIR